jgi:hypothetical protein
MDHPENRWRFSANAQYPPYAHFGPFLSTLCGVLIHPSGNAEAEIYKFKGKSLSFA